ncbi:SMI1/KNR4 family protein [Streptomyces sp. NPDC054933]
MDTTEDLVQWWHRITTWLQHNAPTSAQALRPGAGASDLRALADALGFEVPPHLRAWLSLNNGSTANWAYVQIPGGTRIDQTPDAGIFPGGKVFLDCQSIARQYTEHLHLSRELGDEGEWEPQWIPVVELGDAPYGYAIDASGPPDAPLVEYGEGSLPSQAP